MNLRSARPSGFGAISLAKRFMLAAMPLALAAPLVAAHPHDYGPDTNKTETTELFKPKVDAPQVFKAPEEPHIVTFTPLPDKWNTLTPTKATRLIREIENRANATNPRYPVVIIDDDTVNLRRTGNHQTQRNRVYEILNDRNLSLRWNFKSDIITSMGASQGPTHRNPQAFRMNPDDYKDSANPFDSGVTQSQACVVVTHISDLNSRSLINKWVGSKAGPNVMTARVDPGPYAMMIRTTWHEVWHCLDTYFYKGEYFVRGDPAIDNALRMHQAEVFADVAATLTMAATYPEMAQYMGDIRAISSDYEGRKVTRGLRPTDINYYDGVIYQISRAQDLVAEHIRNAGPEALSRYTLEDIGRIANEITLRGALSKEELQQLAVSLAGGAPPSARVTTAKGRLLTDTGVALPSRRSRTVEQEMLEAHHTAEYVLRDTPAEEKEQIRAAVKDMVAQAIAQEQLPEQGVIHLIDKWRTKIHEEPQDVSVYERKLYLLSLMLSYGALEDDLKREKRRAVKADTVPPKQKADEKPAEEVPAIPQLPETPPTKWQLLPEDHNQARVIMRYQFKLG